MSVNRSQQYLTKSYNKTNGVHRTQTVSAASPSLPASPESTQGLAEKATDIIRQYPTPALIGGFVVGGLLGWFASRSR